jgi:hypothetical protein
MIRMKKLITLVLVICIGALYANVSGQQAETKKNEKKGGFAVGGYDQTKTPAKPAKRGIDIPEEAAGVPAPAMEAKEAKDMDVAKEGQEPVEVMKAEKPKENNGNAYGQDNRGPEKKEIGQERSPAAKEKQKARKNPKSKGKRR